MVVQTVTVPLGNVVITPNALDQLTPADIQRGLQRHANGDWGELEAEDRQENDRALQSGMRLLSSYRSHGGVPFWIITEAGRHATTILMPDDYGSDPYAKEELVAEMGSAFLCGYAGIEDRTIDSSAAYLEGWLKQLKEDKTLIVHAAAQAQKAADFILGHKPEQPAEDIIPKISVPPKPAEVMA